MVSNPGNGLRCCLSIVGEQAFRPAGRATPWSVQVSRGISRRWWTRRLARAVAALCVAGLSVGCGDPNPRTAIDRGEIVVGRARDDGDVWLLTSTARLVRLSLSDHTVVAVTVTGLRPDEEFWGLASTGTGKLLTLIDRSTIATVSRRRHVSGRVAMEGRYLGLYGFRETILVQPVTLQAGRPVLKRLRLGEQPTTEIGSLRLVNYSTRSETLVRSLVACGTTSATELPCWFNQTLRIDRIATAGTGRPLELLGLTSRPLPTPHPDRMDVRGPIIDAHIDRDRMLWVLLRQHIPAGSAGDLLARYTPDGVPMNLQRLEGRARLILDAAEDECLLLGVDGVIRRAVVG